MLFICMFLVTYNIFFRMVLATEEEDDKPAKSKETINFIKKKKGNATK